MKKKLTTLLLAMALGATALVGCAPKTDSTDKSAADTTTIEDIKYTQKVGDVEEEITIAGDPQKVVVFDFGILDMMDTLGLGDKVAGVVKSNLPEYLSKYKNDDSIADIGGLKEADYEAIAAAEPDLIIITGRQSAMYEELKKIATTLYLDMPSTDYITTLKKNAELIGKVFGKVEESKKEVDKIDSLINEVKSSVPADKTALVILANNKSVSVYGPGSRYGIIYKELGIKPVNEKVEEDAKAHGESISYEFIAEQDADYIFVIDRASAIGTEGAETAKTTIENSLVKDTKAYKEDNIVYLDQVVWYLVAGGFESTEQMINEVKAGIAK